MSKAGRAFLLWLLAMLAGAAIVWNSRFTADMSFFLPSHPSAEQQVLVDQLKEGVVSRLLMVAIAGGDETQRAALSRELRGRLAKMPEFVSVQNGESDSQAADRDFLFRHRYLLSPAVTPERFTVDGLEKSISDSVDRLASPLGMLLKPLLPRDPTGEMLELLRGLNAGAQPDSKAGVWASHDGERAMLLIQTTALGSDTDGQENAIKLIRAQFAEAAPGQGIANASLQLSGPGLFAVNSRATIKDEVSRLSTISTLAIVAVLFFVYRSLRLLGLGMLPVVSGALAGVVAVSLAYGTVFGITVGFGSALIGEAVDYSIYYFVQSGRNGLTDWKQRFWPTIRLGVLTSTAGFGALLFSGFPGLAQLGLYSLAGVATAALVTRFVLPQLGQANGQTRDLTPFGRRALAGVQTLRHLRWPVLALALAATATLFAEREHLWNPELAALSPVSQADQAVDMALRADIGAPDARYLVVIDAADRESALRQAEATGQRLDALVASGQLGGYDSPSRFLPSQASQDARRASLPAADQLRPRLQAALVDSPLAAGKLEGFLSDVEQARGAGNIERASLNGTSLALAVDSLLLPHGAGWSVLLPLRAGEQAIAPSAIRSALAGNDALFIDMKAEFDKLYNDYLHEAMLLSLAGLGAIVVLLAATLRSPRRLGAVLLPLVLAVLLVIAGLHLLGERLHLMHLIGMLLIVAVGSNYALFFDRASDEHRLDPETLASMLLANLTTAIGFGTLALSQVPVLHAVGVTVGPGAILALLLAAIFAPRASAA
ncbi:MMPL family transporter [Quatrionicoccus australiensis]|uniref:MMPL family transporter n=1 Tax=Quatrionicoccus australiensis TaxID=138118 RepID=UPI001CFA907F|nr:MMPL family transporter [Quatrionicoccus australiensis]MCB4360017.1 MMPL family transporter [Quatrionicoccus australiensis]